MGICRHTLYFTTNPTQLEIKNRLNNLTRLDLIYKTIDKNSFTIQHPIVKKSWVDVNWYHIDLTKPQSDRLNGDVITVETMPSKQRDYIEISLLYILKELGGELRHAYATGFCVQ